MDKELVQPAGFNYTWLVFNSSAEAKQVTKLHRFSDGVDFVPPFPEDVVKEFNRVFHGRHIDSHGHLHEGCSHPGEECLAVGRAAEPQSKAGSV